MASQVFTTLETLNRHVTLECMDCDLALKQVLLGSGKKGGWMLIGESPSLKPDRNEFVFAGRSRPVLVEILNFIKKSREEVYLTNVAKCYNPFVRTGYLKSCVKYLRQEIEFVNPKKIIVFGSKTIEALGPPRKMWTSSTDLKERIWYYAPHPMTVIHGAYTMEMYMAGFRKMLESKYDE